MDATTKFCLYYLLAVLVALLLFAGWDVHDKRSMCVEAVKANPAVQCWR